MLSHVYNRSCRRLRIRVLQMETLRQRLKEKDDTIEKQLQTVKSAQQDKKNSDSRFYEVSEHMKVKERKICVLQRKVSCNASQLCSSLYYTNHCLLLLSPFLCSRMWKFVLNIAVLIICM